jgi:hypothetical protein
MIAARAPYIAGYRAVAMAIGSGEVCAPEPTLGFPGAGKTNPRALLAGDRSAVRLTKDEWLWALHRDHPSLTSAKP